MVLQEPRMACPTRFRRHLITSLTFGMSCSAFVIAQDSASPAPADNSIVASVQSTFDPNGANDHSQLPKDPGRPDLAPAGPHQTPQPPTYEPFDPAGDFNERGGPPNDNCSSATVI